MRRVSSIEFQLTKKKSSICSSAKAEKTKTPRVLARRRLDGGRNWRLLRSFRLVSRATGSN